MGEMERALTEALPPGSPSASASESESAQMAGDMQQEESQQEPAGPARAEQEGTGVPKEEKIDAGARLSPGDRRQQEEQLYRKTEQENPEPGQDSDERRDAGGSQLDAEDEALIAAGEEDDHVEENEKSEDQGHALAPPPTAAGARTVPSDENKLVIEPAVMLLDVPEQTLASDLKQLLDVSYDVDPRSVEGRQADKVTASFRVVLNNFQDLEILLHEAPLEYFDDIHQKGVLLRIQDLRDGQIYGAEKSGSGGDRNGEKGADDTDGDLPVGTLQGASVSSGATKKKSSAGAGYVGQSASPAKRDDAGLETEVPRGVSSPVKEGATGRTSHELRSRSSKGEEEQVSRGANEALNRFAPTTSSTSARLRQRARLSSSDGAEPRSKVPVAVDKAESAHQSANSVSIMGISVPRQLTLAVAGVCVVLASLLLAFVFLSPGGWFGSHFIVAPTSEIAESLAGVWPPDQKGVSFAWLEKGNIHVGDPNGASALYDAQRLAGHSHVYFAVPGNEMALLRRSFLRNELHGEIQAHPDFSWDRVTVAILNASCEFIAGVLEKNVETCVHNRARTFAQFTRHVARATPSLGSGVRFFDALGTARLQQGQVAGQVAPASAHGSRGTPSRAAGLSREEYDDFISRNLLLAADTPASALFGESKSSILCSLSKANCHSTSLRDGQAHILQFVEHNFRHFSHLLLGMFGSGKSTTAKYQLAYSGASDLEQNDFRTGTQGGRTFTNTLTSGSAGNMRISDTKGLDELQLDYIKDIMVIVEGRLAPACPFNWTGTLSDSVKDSSWLGAIGALATTMLRGLMWVSQVPSFLLILGYFVYTIAMVSHDLSAKKFPDRELVIFLEGKARVMRQGINRFLPTWSDQGRDLLHAFIIVVSLWWSGLLGMSLSLFVTVAKMGGSTVVSLFHYVVWPLAFFTFIVGAAALAAASTNPRFRRWLTSPQHATYRPLAFGAVLLAALIIFSPLLAPAESDVPATPEVAFGCDPLVRAEPDKNSVIHSVAFLTPILSNATDPVKLTRFLAQLKHELQQRGRKLLLVVTDCDNCGSDTLKDCLRKFRQRLDGVIGAEEIVALSANPAFPNPDEKPLGAELADATDVFIEPDRFLQLSLKLRADALSYYRNEIRNLDPSFVFASS